MHVVQHTILQIITRLPFIIAKHFILYNSIKHNLNLNLNMIFILKQMFSLHIRSVKQFLLLFYCANNGNPLISEVLLIKSQSIPQHIIYLSIYYSQHIIYISQHTTAQNKIVKYIHEIAVCTGNEGLNSLKGSYAQNSVRFNSGCDHNDQKISNGMKGQPIHSTFGRIICSECEFALALKLLSRVYLILHILKDKVLAIIYLLSKICYF